MSDHVHHVFDGMCVYCQAEELERLTAERDALIGELRKIAGREMDNFNDVTQLDQCINIAIEALQKIGSGKAQSIDTAYLIARDALKRCSMEPTSPKGDPADWLAALRQAQGGGE